MHTQINDDGCHILHISPLGYISPSSIDESRLLINGKWPVLHNPVMENRISLFGTSQGGLTSLLLGALFPEQFRCICADLLYNNL